MLTNPALGSALSVWELQKEKSRCMLDAAIPDLEGDGILTSVLSGPLSDLDLNAPNKRSFHLCGSCCSTLSVLISVCLLAL